MKNLATGNLGNVDLIFQPLVNREIDCKAAGVVGSESICSVCCSDPLGHLTCICTLFPDLNFPIAVGSSMCKGT